MRILITLAIAAAIGCNAAPIVVTPAVTPEDVARQNAEEMQEANNTVDLARSLLEIASTPDEVSEANDRLQRAIDSRDHVAQHADSRLASVR